MASLVLLRNPLVPHTREQFELKDGQLVIDWLQEHYPNGFGMPITFHLNGKERDLDDLDTPLVDTDVAVIATMPAAGASLLTMVLLSAALSLVTAFVMRAFMPKMGSGKMKGEVQTFNISSSQNQARVGEAIPVVYGSVIMTPDYVSEPYTWFDWTQVNNIGERYRGIQYLDLLLCVGQGNVDVSNVYIGDTATNTLETGIVSWRKFYPSEHKKWPGTIAAAMGPGFHENVVSAPEISNQEFINNSDKAGFFAVCRPGQKGNKIQFDIVFPNGASNPDGKGDVYGRKTDFTVYWQEINDNDVAVSAVSSAVIVCDTRQKQTVTGPVVGTTQVTPDASEKNRTVIMSPLRRTYTLNMPRSARWAVKIVRNAEAPNTNQGTDRFMWTGLKCFLTYPATQVYGDVTLLAIRIRASNGIGADAAVRIRAKVTRRLSPPAGGAEAQSTSGADAFADIYTNAVYGAARPRTELDVTTLNSLRTKWVGGGYQFNYMFSNQTTVWEALRTVTTPFGAEPLPLGQMMSVAQDGVKAIRSALFTDSNIVDNTLNVEYSFNEPGAPDGVEFEYINPVDFRPAFVRYPSNSLRPQKYQLPGVTSSTHAAQYARLTWQRNIYQRKKVTFETELEGLILNLGDRIGISHNVPQWGDAGLVIGISGRTLQVDHKLYWTGGGRYIMLRKADGSVTDPIAVVRGNRDDLVVLPTTSPVAPNIDNAYDYTSFAFGTATSMVRDFIVVAVKPTENNTVVVEAVNYNPSIFVGAMTYMD